jgi:hypothetical protein
MVQGYRPGETGGYKDGVLLERWVSGCFKDAVLLGRWASGCYVDNVLIGRMVGLGDTNIR